MKILLTIIINKIKSVLKKVKIAKRWFRLRNYQMDTKYGSKTPRLFVLTAWIILFVGMTSYICYQALKSEENITETDNINSNNQQNQSTFDMIMDLFNEEQ